MSETRTLNNLDELIGAKCLCIYKEGELYTNEVSDETTLLCEIIGFDYEVETSPPYGIIITAFLNPIETYKVDPPEDIDCYINNGRPLDVLHFDESWISQRYEKHTIYKLTRKKESIIVRLTEEQFDILKRHANKNQLSVSKAARGIIFDYLDYEER